ncbi:MAG: PIN domain-containing protein [Nitrospinae bacterium]|nr:PIN domain-containing protein [Nitrospinota bacterium]
MASTSEIIDTNITIVKKGAEIKHRQKIPYIDSLVGATAIVNGCKKLYTSDRKHMKGLKDYGLEVVFIRE